MTYPVQREHRISAVELRPPSKPVRFPRSLEEDHGSIMDAPNSASVPLSFTPSRPELPLPDLSVIRALDGQYRVGEGLTDIHLADTDQKIRDFQEICAQKAEVVRKNAERMKTSQVWGYLKKIASYIVAAISTVFGLALIKAAGLTIVAGAMVASGVLAVANLIFIETQLWDYFIELAARDNEERKKTLRWLAPAIVGGLSATLGLIGSGGAILWGPLNFSQAATATALTAVSFVQGVTTIGTSVAKARSLWAEAELIAVETRREVQQLDIQRAESDFQKLMQTQSRAAQTASQIIRLSSSNYQEMLI